MLVVWSGYVNNIAHESGLWSFAVSCFVTILFGSARRILETILVLWSFSGKFGFNGNDYLLLFVRSKFYMRQLLEGHYKFHSCTVSKVQPPKDNSKW
ncbi:hypothetical protein GOP47_0025302 [Adiantum capillus-veneris]|uniref:Uncharacterized protein n=1 Tax=Adiantum capillus-veneris TaxID=13818 RepID=A0A9D4U123_ADICA|nr:hypothetical protein GOP47_0025302 [Adiantum capillus-veneris]